MDGLDFFLSEMLILARGAAFSLAGSGSDSLPVDDIVLDSTLIGEAAAAAVFVVLRSPNNLLVSASSTSDARWELIIADRCLT